MLRLIIFAIVSVSIVLLSWKSLQNLRSHGFFRFFAFECVLGLFLLNVGFWFHEPFSIIHVISWLLLLSSLVMVVNGFYLLRREMNNLNNALAEVTKVHFVTSASWRQFPAKNLRVEGLHPQFQVIQQSLFLRLPQLLSL